MANTEKRVFISFTIILCIIIYSFSLMKSNENKYAKRLGFSKTDITDYYIDDDLALKIQLFDFIVEYIDKEGFLYIDFDTLLVEEVRYEFNVVADLKLR